MTKPMQHVECETCGEVFLHMDAWEYTRVARAYLNRDKQPRISWRDVASDIQLRNYSGVIARANKVVAESKSFYDKFTCKAILHWCDNPDHTIVVSVPLGNNGPIQRFDMTANLKWAYEAFGTRFLDAERKLMELSYDEGATI